MSKDSMPPPYGTPSYGAPPYDQHPSAPPTYVQAIRGVPPSSPYVPTHACKYKQFFFVIST